MSGTTGSLRATSPSSSLNVLTVVCYTNVLLLIIFILVVLVRFPRLFARFYQHSEWTSGHFLRHVPVSTKLDAVPAQIATDSLSWSEIVDLSADGNSDTLVSEKSFGARRLSLVNTYFPPHIPSCVSGFSWMLKLMHSRLVPGVPYSHLTVMVVWLAILCFPAFYKTNPFTDPQRYGWIAASQLPFVYALGTKNNIVGFLLGVGYEKLNFLHRFIGRVVLVLVNAHALGFFYKWFIAKQFRENISQPKNSAGLVALICIDSLFFFSTKFWRQKAYTVFVTTHILSLTVLLFALSFHYEGARPWIYICALIYLFDICLRIAKTRMSIATIGTIDELGITRVEIPRINSGWRAGQHVRLRVVSSGMGLLGWTEIHPFTISSIADGPDGLVLLCKKTGKWTNRLFDMAKTNSSCDEDRKVSVMVEGPYGGLGNRMIASFSAAVFVVGGSGITFAISALQDLIRKSLNKQSRVKFVELIWTVQDPFSLVPMLPLLSAMIQDSALTSMSLRISVFYTRASAGEFRFKEAFSRFPGLSPSPGRPGLQSIFEQTIDRTVVDAMSKKVSELEDTSGLFVGVCGPVGLADSVFADLDKVNSQRRAEVGGIEVHEETFGW
jgi:ferric-chelate reductase